MNSHFAGLAEPPRPSDRHTGRQPAKMPLSVVIAAWVVIFTCLYVLWFGVPARPIKTYLSESRGVILP